MKSFKQVRLSENTHKDLRIYAAILGVASLNDAIAVLLEESAERKNAIRTNQGTGNE